MRVLATVGEIRIERGEYSLENLAEELDCWTNDDGSLLNARTSSFDLFRGFRWQGSEIFVRIKVHRTDGQTALVLQGFGKADCLLSPAEGEGRDPGGDGTDITWIENKSIFLASSRYAISSGPIRNRIGRPHRYKQAFKITCLLPKM